MNLYEILNERYEEEINFFKIRLSSIIKEELSQEEQHDLEVLKKVFDVHEIFSDDGTSISYRLWNTAVDLDLSYLNNNEFNDLKLIIQKEIPLVLKTRIQGVLCSINFKDCIDIVDETVDNYLQLLKKAIDKDEWYIAKISAIMAIFLSKKLGVKQALFKNTISNIKDKVFEIMLDENSVFFVIAAIKKLAVLKMVNSEECENTIKTALVVAQNNPNDYLLNEIIDVCKKLKMNIKDISKNIVDIYVKAANKTSSAMQAVCMLEEAIIIAREAGLDEEELNEMLSSKQKEIENRLHSFRMEIPICIDKEYIKRSLEGKSIDDAIKMILDFIDPVLSKYYNKQEMRPKVFGRNIRIIDDNGITICSPSNEEYNNYSLFSNYVVIASTHIKICLEVLNELFRFSEDSLRFLFEDNELIEEERISLFTCAYSLAFQNRFYEAVYLLAPQAEYVFRRIAEMNGANIVNFHNDGSSEYYNLTALLNNKAVIECLDENYLSAFKLLLNEKIGANIRNLAAHGLLNNDNICSIIYFCFLLLKLCVGYKLNGINKSM